MTRIIPADKGTHFVAGAGITAVVLLLVRWRQRAKAATPVEPTPPAPPAK